MIVVSLTLFFNSLPKNRFITLMINSQKCNNLGVLQ